MRFPLPSFRPASRRRGAGFAFVLAVALLGTRPASADSTCVDTSSGPFGSLVSAAEFDASVQALPPAAFFKPPVQLRLPARAFLTNLPAVSQQGTAAVPGSPGTCEAQSFGYGLGSYTAARAPDGSPKWDPALPQNSASAAYLFALAVKHKQATCPAGGLALEYPARLVAFGAPNRAAIPYKPVCTYFDTTIPEQADFPDKYPAMKRLRIGSYAAFHIDTDPAAAIELIKEFIANGQAVAFSGRVLCGYGTDLHLQHGVIYETDYIVNNGKPAGHGQLIVGYNDKIGAPGRKGAFLVQNSFGTAWPTSAGGRSSPAPPGMLYWSYSSFEATQLLAAVAYPRAAGPPAAVKLSGSMGAPPASIGRGFQWAPRDNPQATYLVLTHFFGQPVLLKTVELTEPGGAGTTATAVYGQYISAGYSYLSRRDGNAFLPGVWAVTLEGTDLSGNPITYTGTVRVGAPRPTVPPAASMEGHEIFGSTGAKASLTP